MRKSSLKSTVTIGMLIALHIILSRFLSINAWNIKIGFAFVPVFAAAFFLGPVAAALVGGLGDFLGAILFPIGPYFPGFTLSCALTGLVFGLLLHKKQTLPRMALAVGINQFGISLFLTTFWISTLYGSPYLPLLATRVVQAAVLALAEMMVLLALSKAFQLRSKFALA